MAVFSSHPIIALEICCSVTASHWYVSIVLPLRITVMRSQICLISGILWEINTMVWPWAFNCRSSSNNWSISCGVKTAVGSSKIRISAPRASAFKISTFCFSPTGRFLVVSSGSTGRLNRSPSSLVNRTASFWSINSPFLGSMPSTMFWATVKDSTSIKCWCTIPIPFAMASFEPENTVFSPLKKISPREGCSIPNSIFISVDFPAPFSPTSAWISPFFRLKLTSELATTPFPYIFAIWFISNIYSLIKILPPLYPTTGMHGSAPAQTYGRTLSLISASSSVERPMVSVTFTSPLITFSFNSSTVLRASSVIRDW